ncbi:MAG: type II secretion system F family protein [Candidatus Nanopelagicaceae bacterium]
MKKALHSNNQKRSSQLGESNFLKSLLASALTLLITSSLTSSLFIGLAFATLVGAATAQYLKQRKAQRKTLLGQVWPEVIDHLVSGLYSGLSISESLSGLALRGPEFTRNDFKDFNQNLKDGMNFNEALQNLRETFDHPGSDQIFEALLLSKTLGGGELLNILKTLSAFQREELALKKEIAIKHGWIKSSAHISAAAPWLLLLMIGTQSGTATAFSSPDGIAILVLGVALTFAAYAWMSKLSRLHEAPRVFRS